MRSSHQHHVTALYALQERVHVMGLRTLKDLQENHRQWVNEELENDQSPCGEFWVDSIAVGDKAFVSKIQNELGITVRNRNIELVDSSRDRYVLREEPELYSTVFGHEKDALRGENRLIWDV